MVSRRQFAIAACIGALALVSGCATKSSALPQRNMVEVAYGMADRLVETSAFMLDPTKPVLVATAVNIDNLQSSSTFGRTLTDLMASRLTQRGITVSDIRLRNAVALRPEGEMMLSRRAAEVTRSHNAQALVVSTYSVMATNVYVSTKVVRASDNAIIASADEVLPYAD